MSVVGLIRSGSVNYALFLHVLGATLLVGTLFAVALAVALNWRARWASAGLTRFALLMVPFGVLPAFVLMRVGAQWTESKESIPDEATWLGIGYTTADGGAILILVMIVVAVFGLRRVRAGGGATRFAGAVGIISTLLIAAYVVAVWAMSTKPA